MDKFTAVLSTTVLPLDGCYDVTTVESADVKGVNHYIGHPGTRTIVENLGAIQAPNKMFSGLKVGQKAVCFSIKQGMSTRATIGYTEPNQSINMDMLTVRVITRLANNAGY